MHDALPIAGSRVFRSYLRRIGRDHRRDLVVIVVLHGAAAGAGLVVPWLIGDLVEAATDKGGYGTIDRIAIFVAVCLLAQTVLTRWARLRSAVFGETVLARLREDFVDEALGLPIGVVESAGTGDLLTRTSRDVDTLGWSVRFAVPETVVALVTAACTIAAALLVGGWVAVPLVLGVPVIWVASRWYLARARAGYIREHASYSRINTTLAETVEGARTVEALGLGAQRSERIDADIAESYAAESYTRNLRSVFFPAVEIGYLVPVVATLLVGGWLMAQGSITLAQMTAAVLYVRFLIDPVDRIISWMDTLQVGATSLARLLGVAEVPDDRVPTGRTPAGEEIELDDVRFSYIEGREVLHGVDLELAAGERLAVVGPSGAGKSTIGRLIAGIQGPTSGAVTVGGVGVTELELDDLRRRVALLTQEHHVFVGTVRDNLQLALEDGGTAADDRLWAALDAVGARDWVAQLPHGLDTMVGSGGHRLTDAQAQHLALARVVLTDPHTLVLDEATSLIDPRAARALERSLSAVLEGRTVVAIAHRLYTAHDADRVAVVEDGAITELGSHDELVARGGSYAALWKSWQS
ncbi:ABC transporter ATP-binding protein/permease [Mumia sp. zg.B17]|uniref:ABC transporter ATP-binding protein n=1 Tax=Mumia sp. zg.B17 TaxID=2855446 RepID=UPI001C6E7ADC|nr:ABC transporter ATP-binding protein [Mumia sp. zg.B17]MBW9204756.1 ABC transporter ATP-binding protein/permease [Mumia sp. zg.B17]